MLYKYSLLVLKSTLTTPNSFYLRSSFFSSDVNKSAHFVQTRDKSGHVRSQATVLNQTRICAQSKLRSSWCLAKSKVERIYSCFVLKLNVFLLQSQHQSSLLLCVLTLPDMSLQSFEPREPTNQNETFSFIMFWSYFVFERSYITSAVRKSMFLVAFEI